MLRNVIIRYIKEKDIKDILRIADIQLGQGYLDAGKVVDMVEGNSPLRCLVATLNDEVIGFCSYEVFTHAQMFEYIQSEVPLFKNEERIGYIRSLASAPHSAKKGLGSALIAQVVACFYKMGIYHMFAGAWKPGDNINAGKTLEKNGFKKYKEVKNYYLKESLNTEFICPYCGETCYCSVVFYIR